MRTASIFSLTISQHCYKTQQILVAVITGFFHPYLSHIPLSSLLRYARYVWHSQEHGSGEHILHNWSNFWTMIYLGNAIFLIDMAEIMALEPSVWLSGCLLCKLCKFAPFNLRCTYRAIFNSDNYFERCVMRLKKSYWYSSSSPIFFTHEVAESEQFVIWCVSERKCGNGKYLQTQLF